MGVPKFYRWLSERYPKINQIISDLMLMPEFDNLYLDMVRSVERKRPCSPLLP